mgnify:CR=1 FL=1
MGKNLQRTVGLRRLAIVLVVSALLALVGASPLFTLAKATVATATDILANYLTGQLSYSTADKLFLSANHHFLQGNYTKTIDKFEELIRKHPDQLNYEKIRQIHAMLGLSYEQTGQNEKKLQTYEQLMTVDPAYAHFLKGAAFDSEGRFSHAKREFELALETATIEKPLDESSSQIIHYTLERYSHEKPGKREP